MPVWLWNVFAWFGMLSLAACLLMLALVIYESWRHGWL